jgi:hypothetical protein
MKDKNKKENKNGNKCRSYRKYLERARTTRNAFKNNF